ncbi:hypothetical protein [Sphingomonas sp. AOB5]|uniref:hypothetical protein n=1 Tax=Sphingomonas sp. AOB5 TaxID=3034017 RepID=UPI0023F817AE|nr:hypothetical protein [Sphingomonas sp. AOB5]
MAQTAPSAGSEPAELRALLECRGITDNAARLACFDAASARFDVARQRGDLAVVDREEVRKTRRGLFGFRLPGISLFGGDKEGGDELAELTGKVVSARRGSDGWTITLEGGAVWQQTDAVMLGRSPKPGSTVVIRRAALGSYKMNVDGGPAIKVRRIG